MMSPALERQAALAASAPSCRRILVPLDGSPEAEAVLPHAQAIARQFGATVELVRAYATPPALLDTGAYLAAGRAEAELYLEGVQSRIGHEGVEVEHRRLEGAAGASIVEEAARSGADIIAMTTHGRGGLDRLVHGSIASYVTDHATCPVLLVRPDTNPSAH